MSNDTSKPTPADAQPSADDADHDIGYDADGTIDTGVGSDPREARIAELRRTAMVVAKWGMP